MWDAILLLAVCIGLIAVAVVGLHRGLLPSVAVGVIVLAVVAGVAAGRVVLAALSRRGRRHDQM